MITEELRAAYRDFLTHTQLISITLDTVTFRALYMGGGKVGYRFAFVRGSGEYFRVVLQMKTFDNDGHCNFTCRYGANYGYDGGTQLIDVPDEMIWVYIHKNSRMHLYPYVRELAQGLMGRCGYTQSPLPLLLEVDADKKEEK